MARLFLIVLCLFAVPTTALAENIFLMGDSQLGGLHRPLRERLEADGHRVVVEYHNGWSAGSYVAQGRLRSTARGCDVAVVVLGGNNHVREEARYLRNVEWIVSSLRAAGVREVLWFGPAHTTDPRIRARKTYTALMQEHLLVPMGVVWFDTVPGTMDLSLRDRVHFTRRSYQEWARRIHIQIQQNL